MNKISTEHIIAFAVGAAIGSAITYKIAKDKFAKMLETEIELMREYYLGVSSYGEPKEKEPEKEIEPEEPKVEEAEAIIKDFHYSVYQESEEDGLVRQKADRYKPYVIPPELFGEDDSYDTETLTYYADGVLTDDQDVPIEDVQGMVGHDSLMRFGEYEPDAVYVRNDRLKIDFEILLDDDRYESLKTEEYD